jgi:hypothetical protein
VRVAPEHLRAETTGKIQRVDRGGARKDRPAIAGRLILAGVLALAAWGVFVAVFQAVRTSNSTAVASVSDGPIARQEERLAPAPSEVAPSTPELNAGERYLQARQDFLASVDESISGSRIAGNPYKFVGAGVDLHGTVSNVPSPGLFNFISSDANVVVIGDTSQLEPNEWLRVIGTVVEPQAGMNLFGAATTFPTVQAKWIEYGREARPAQEPPLDMWGQPVRNGPRKKGGGT